MKLVIKNMVCNRCITVVQQEFEKMNFSIVHIKLGEVITDSVISDTELKILNEKLELQGFEILDDKKTIIIEKVKNIVVGIIHGTDMINLKTNFSELIQDNMAMSYNSISSLFSSTEGITIEQYIIQQRIERAKELLVYNELSLSEISFKLGYASIQHLSTQFKKITGTTPSQFKNITEKNRKPIDYL
ncbi:AraC family transcriptional regulator [Flavobacterium enshiense]|uniref:helix-turn-helix domain-containing protein n=1 Tax=Flavobacterium enshiense TaxID=1341165 RepID=UPI00345D6FCC